MVTGILLLFYYRPTTTEAYESVQFIMTKVEFGWLIRSVHSWSANLMILAAFIHMFSVVFLHAYRKPRELTWLSGIALLGLALAFGFSGYLLPWNKVSYFATKVGTDMAASVPLIGPESGAVSARRRGCSGSRRSAASSRCTSRLLPGLTTMLLLVHLLLVQKHGISAPALDRGAASCSRCRSSRTSSCGNSWPGMERWPSSARSPRFFPWELGEKADPFASAPAGIRPEWYFLAPFYTLKLIPSHVSSSMAN